jgi:hypothetical protein
MTTIVSGFISNSNTYRSVDRYVEFGIKLLNINVPKIIFVDEIMYDKIKSYENEFTKIILYDKKESYLYPYINNEHLINFKVNTDLHSKDTMEYMFIQCNKTEWIKNAIEINYFNTTQFVWIDFGIRHVITSDDNLNKYILNLQNKAFTKVRIGTIWNLNYVYNTNIYTHIAWYFAGGVFGGDKDVLLVFSEKMKTQCLKVITEKQTIMWETNIWYLIYLDNKELFDGYACNHNDSIIENY